MNQEALLARAVPRRCVRPPPNKSAGEFRSVGKTQSGLEHLARVRERQRDFSLVMQQLEESTETALATAAPVRQREEKSAATARAPAHTSPAAGAASSPVGALPRKASPRQVRRNVAAGSRWASDRLPSVEAFFMPKKTSSSGSKKSRS
eukprot:COSAG02_NODE_22825_length_739_cov_1.101562_1_plen_148_part_10